MYYTSDKEQAEQWQSEGINVIPLLTAGPEGVPITIWRTKTRSERRSEVRRLKNRRGHGPTTKGVARRDKGWLVRLLDLKFIPAGK